MATQPENKLSPLGRAAGVLQAPRTKRWGMRALLALLAFGLLGYFAGPPVLKSVLVDQASRALHRPVQIERIDINPYALSATLGGLSIRTSDGQGEQLGFAELYVNLEAVSLVHRGVVIKELRLSKPRIHVARLREGEYDISDLLAEWLKPSDSPPPRFSVNNIEIADGTVEFDDRPVGKVHTLSDIQVKLPFVSNLPYQTDIVVEPSFAATVDGAPVSLKGRSKPFAATHESELALDLDRFDLSRIQPYLPTGFPVAVKGGAVDSELKLLFAEQADKVHTLTLAGAVHVAGMALSEGNDRPLLAWNRLDVDLQGLDLVNQRFVVDRVRLDGLAVHASVDRRGVLNWLAVADKLAAGNAPDNKDTSSAAGKAAEWSLGHLELTGGTVHWRDESNPVVVAGRLENLKVSVEKVDSTLVQPLRLDLAYTVDFGDALKIPRVEAKGVAIDLGKHAVEVGELGSQGSRVHLVRNQSGLIAWLNPPRLAAAKNGPKAGEASKPWSTMVHKLAIEDVGVRFEDQLGGENAVHVVDGLSVVAENLSTAGGARSTVAVRGKVNQKGQLKVDGNVQLQPLAANLSVETTAIPILPLQAYFADYLNISLTRGQLSNKGQVAIQVEKGGLNASYKGDLTLGDFNSIDKGNSSDFLRWKSLYVGGIDFRLQPLAVKVGEVACTDFYSRLIVSPEGKINLAQIVRKPDDKAPATAPAPVVAASGGASTVPTPAEPAKAVLPITIGKVTLQGGTVNFTDRFIKPNYTVNLTKVGGRITGLSSAANTVADMDLRASYANTAPVQILAKLNPLAAKSYLDLKAEVNGVDLSPFSPYSGKYAGYAIEKGKLSLFLTYKLENNQLSADNRVFLDQLTFGEKVDSPDATKLPVNLAVALLKNGRGEIDINLPISGSLDDPQFSVGGVIVKVIINLFVKAVTSPFALLGSLFGGGEELSHIEFDSGRAVLAAAATKRLESLAKAIVDRPALKLEITGRVDPEADREGLKQVALELAVKAEKLKERVRKGIESGSADSVDVDPKEYAQYLTRAYKEAKFPKPRNLVGFQKDLPVEEMEKLMLANLPAGEEDLRQLAARRAEAVAEWLQDKGQVPSGNLFVLPPKLGPDGKGDGKVKDSRVDFSLR